MNIITVLIPTLIMIIYVEWRQKRMINQYVEQFKPLVSKAFGLISEKGVEARKVKQIEKAVMDDIMNAQFPEIQLLLQYISPETAEMIKENPQAIPILIRRWLPLIQTLMGMSKQNQANTNYHIGE